MSTVFELSLIGGCTLFGPDRKHVGIPNKKASALLAYLALKANGVETRERLAGLLWSESGEEQARASLRQCLKQLRLLFERIGFAGFQADRQNIALDQSRLKIDIDDIQTGLQSCAISDRLIGMESPAERILYGFESLDQLYTNWLMVLRRQYHDRGFDLLQACLRNNVGTVKSVADTLISIDPTHEEAHRALIRNFANEGNTGAALEQYSKLWTILDEEYDTEPGEETQALIVDIKSGTFQPTRQAAPQKAAGAAPKADGAGGPTNVGPNTPIIGIRPFDKVGPWDGDDYLIEGFRRELAGALAKFREWSVFEFTGDQSPEQAANALQDRDAFGYLYVLEGTYFSIDNKIFQTITLKHAKTAKYVWSEQIDLSMESWFAARRQLLQRLAGALNIYLSADRQQQIMSQPTVSLDLYDRWLKGQALSFKWSPDSDEQAVEILEEIIKAAPNFAAAYSSLVQIENTRQLVSPGVFPTREREKRALELAKKAVQLDTVDTKTHLSLAWAYVMNRQFELAEMSYRLAYELNKNDPWTLISVATGLAFCGQYDDALGIADDALHLDLSPSPSHWLYQSTVRYLAGQVEEAAEMGARAEGITHGSLAWQAAALVEVGDVEAAKGLAERFKQRCLGMWQGEDPPTETSPGDWAMSIYPIKDANARKRLKTGMARAGILSSD